MTFKDTFFSKKTSLNCRGKLLDLSAPRVMGILNVTPDSFYDGGRYVTDDLIKERIDMLVSDGADIIDIGACSTRPGASEVSSDEEMRRLEPAMTYTRRQYPDAIISVDTFRAEVAVKAITICEADMVNDISAGRADPLMLDTIAGLAVPYVMMHMQGTPATMQVNPVYDDVVKEIISFFAERLQKTSSLGIKDIIIDPGFGFGKTIEHNFQLLKGLKAFSVFELPVMAGLSRKSMIYKSLGISSDEALNGTTVLNTLALLNGVNLLRVHDVKEAKEVLKLFMAYKAGGEGGSNW
ncbi:MAG: dihydropteroate synthase [Bacteroidales bacterium]|nr:dihydropteroate synthase [Bacteroidales bacterium]MBN2764546.1 dihydropteroate synthase [Bacteroidales bacterium]